MRVFKHCVSYSLAKGMSLRSAILIYPVDSKLLKGAPIALQLVGPRLGDAQLLRDVELIDRVLRK